MIQKEPFKPRKCMDGVCMDGDCDFSKLSCRTRWLANESKKAELLGSKLLWYLPEFMQHMQKWVAWFGLRKCFTQMPTISDWLFYVENIVLLRLCRAQASCNGVINCYLNYLKPGIKGLGVDADKLLHVGREKFSILFFLYIL